MILNCVDSSIRLPASWLTDLGLMPGSSVNTSSFAVYAYLRHRGYDVDKWLTLCAAVTLKDTALVDQFSFDEAKLCLEYGLAASEMLKYRLETVAKDNSQDITQYSQVDLGKIGLGDATDNDTLSDLGAKLGGTQDYHYHKLMEAVNLPEGYGHRTNIWCYRGLAYCISYDNWFSYEGEKHRWWFSLWTDGKTADDRTMLFIVRIKGLLYDHSTISVEPYRNNCVLLRHKTHGRADVGKIEVMYYGHLLAEPEINRPDCPVYSKLLPAGEVASVKPLYGNVSVVGEDQYNGRLIYCYTTVDGGIVTYTTE